MLGCGALAPQIGTLAARDPSTVAYWVKKHGFVANGKGSHAPRGGLTREQLAPLIDRGATMREIADALDVSQSTVRYWLKKLGMRTKNRVGRRRR